MTLACALTLAGCSADQAAPRAVGGAAGQAGEGVAGASAGQGGAGASGAGGNGTSGAGTAGGGHAGEVGGGSAGQAGAPPRMLNVTASAERHEHTFLPSEADPEVDVATTFSDGPQVALVDPRSTTMLGKLVVTLGGAGSTQGFVGGVGDFCAERGFHVFAVTYFADYDIVRGDPEFYGLARREVFEGVDYTDEYEFATVEITPPDSIQGRLKAGLAHLQSLYPEEDWAYFLEPNGDVRWSDVIFAGLSHGATASARIAKLRVLDRAVSLSGPRDNDCLDMSCEGGVVASWFDETSATPNDRYFALTGEQDEQHPQHLFAMERLSYSGAVVDVDTAEPPYEGSRRLKTSSGGHETFCGDAEYDDACNYLFGVPEENWGGVP